MKFFVSLSLLCPVPCVISHHRFCQPILLPNQCPQTHSFFLSCCQGLSLITIVIIRIFFRCPSRCISQHNLPTSIYFFGSSFQTSIWVTNHCRRDSWRCFLLYFAFVWLVSPPFRISCCSFDSKTFNASHSKFWHRSCRYSHTESLLWGGSFSVVWIDIYNTIVYTDGLFPLYTCPSNGSLHSCCQSRSLVYRIVGSHPYASVVIR